MKLRLLLAVALLCPVAYGQAAKPMQQAHPTFVNSAGSPCSGCLLYSYSAGTTTPLATYVDSTGTGQNSNPITLDNAGGANIFMGVNSYKFVLKDSLGNTLWTADNVSPYISSSGGTINGDITVTGNFTVNGTINFTVPANKVAGTAIVQAPTAAQTITQPTTTQFTVNNETITNATLSNVNAFTVYMQSGQTLAAALTQLESISSGAGGVIRIPPGTWKSGGFSCTVPNVQIIGAGRPSVNSGNTALSGGTIIQGTVAASQGCAFFVLKDLGVDVGSAWVAAGNVAADAVSIYNNGQVVGATPLDGVVIDNVVALGSSLSTAFHAILVENVTNSMIHNVVAIYHQHGIVLKGTHSHIDGFYSAGHSVDSVDVKSDTYAPSHDDTVTNGMMTYLTTAGDTLGLQINSEHAGTGVPVQRISVSNVQAYGLANASGGAAFFITGAETFNPATDITLTDILVDWPSASPTNVACVSLIQSVARVNIKGLNCRNVYQGVNYVTPSVGFMGDISLTNSYFDTIQNSAVLTYGNWTASGNECKSVTVNCFVNQIGNLNLGINTVLSSGAYFNNIGGTMQFDYRAYAVGSSAPVTSPGEVYGQGNATAGQLAVSYGVTFNGIPVCIPAIVSTASGPGTTTVPTVWIVSATTTGATFNTSSATYTGPITWSCRGLLQ